MEWNIDKAAQEYASTLDNNFLKPEVVIRIFKAGAKWREDVNKEIDEDIKYVRQKLDEVIERQLHVKLLPRDSELDSKFSQWINDVRKKMGLNG